MIAALAGPNPATSDLASEADELREQISHLEFRLQANEQRRRAMLHIMSDLAESNRRLNDQRRAMLHILVDDERDRTDLARQTEGLNNSRRALMHILQDAHGSNLKLEQSRKAMIHIMGDLRQTTEDIAQREKELREKQDQLVQAAKLATLGELTTGVAHELNNPLNNIGLYVGNVLDQLTLGLEDRERMAHNLEQVMDQVAKATEIINHLRTFGRAAPVSREPVSVNDVVVSALSLLREQMRLREIDIVLRLSPDSPEVLANAIQMEQVLMNLLTNARDALTGRETRLITVTTGIEGQEVRIDVEDTGPGIPPELLERIFDPFFTTKDVGAGTGLGLSIVYGIMKDHAGSITAQPRESGGAHFVVRLPRAVD